MVGEWVERLWGISRDRQEDAQARILSWQLPNVSRETSPDLADGAMAAVLLVESVEELVERGIDERKLLRKLRNDPDVWPTWAELRAASLIARSGPADMELQSELGRAAGKHPDFTLAYSHGGSAAIEFKAVGLSDQEVLFCQSMERHLEGLLPRRGIVTMHVADTSTTINMNRAERRRHQLEGERRAKYIHPVGRDMSAAVVVGRGTEETYTRRLTARFREALAQLPQEDAWVAFHWSNGAPIRMVRRALARAGVPDHVGGVIILGSVAIPGSFDHFVMIFPAPFEDDAEDAPGDELWDSDRSIEDAKGLFEAVDQSAGVRATLIRVPAGGRRCDFLRRVGDRRILPFNVILAPDPLNLVGARDPHGT